MDYTVQQCPACNTPMELVDNYVGGGSHYYSFRCPNCAGRFMFDTYRFQLEPMPPAPTQEQIDQWVADYKSKK